jgi:ribonuclease BN (tRNA processing enzyme)
MKLQVLGCSGAIAQRARTTSFLIDGHVLIDAGTGVGDLSLQEMARIDHVLLTHSHLDHVAALPLMLDTVASERQTAIQVHALPATIAALRSHIFNHVIWPDFSVIPSPDNPLVRFSPLQVGDVVDVVDHRIEVLPAHHSVPAVGYAVDTPSGHWVFTGDTERNPAFWQRINQMQLAMLVIEVAFSQREEALAHRSRHLCPSTLAQELAQLHYPADRRFPIGLTHTKPAETALIRTEVEALGLDQKYQLVWLESGQTFEF